MRFVGNITAEEALDKNTYYSEVFLNVSYTKNGVSYSTNYGSSSIVSMSIKRSLYAESKPSVGGVMAAQLDVELINYDLALELFKLLDDENESVTLQPIVRFFSIASDSVVANAYEEYFFPDTTDLNTDTGKVVIHAYDALGNVQRTIGSSRSIASNYLFYVTNSSDWNTRFDPNAITTVLAGVLSSKLLTTNNLTANDWQYTNHMLALNVNDTVEKALKAVATLCFGNFIIKNNELHLVRLFDMPDETFYLVNENRNYITFGGTRILIR